MARRLAGLGLLGALALGGCAGGDEGGGGKADRKVQTTRVEVIKQAGKGSGFDPAALYDRLSPGVVTVESIFKEGAASVLGDERGEAGQGSGFVLDGDGYVATNAHVVTTGNPSRAKRAEEVYVEFSNGNRVKARIIGQDPNSDVALLKVDPKGLELTPLKLGTSKDLGVGEPVAAIGSPFGERQSLSVGVISARDRAIEALTKFSIGDAIQTDAAINPGNSGGPLLNARGEVLGINSQIKSASGGGEGVGFAVPVDTVRRSLRELRRSGKVEYGYLGVQSVTLWPQAAERLKVDAVGGAAILRIEPGSPAEDADLDEGRRIRFQGSEIPVGGDVVVGVDGRKLTREEDLADIIGTLRPGETIKLDVLRDGDRRSVNVKLGDRPLEAP